MLGAGLLIAAWGAVGVGGLAWQYTQSLDTVPGGTSPSLIGALAVTFVAAAMFTVPGLLLAGMGGLWLRFEDLRLPETRPSEVTFAER